MAEEKRDAAEECHKKSAVDTFNLVWSLLDKKGRSKEENDKMVHAAHASRFHWGEIGTAVEVERGEWQISRVYSVLHRADSALYHAKRCLEICQQKNIGDFDIAFAYEAMARASTVAGDRSNCEHYLKLATEAGKQIREKGDRDYFFNQLKTIPGCGEG